MFNPKRKGFFPYIYVALEQSLSDEDQWVDFESACQKSPGGSAGLTFAHGLLCRQEKRNLLQIVQVNCGEKCGKKSAHNREAGNAQFYAGNFKQAQLLYSVAVFTAPTNNDNGNDNLPLALANRSACFQRLKAPQLALNDIEFALQTGYPPNKAFKLLERRGECILALKQDLDKGLEAFEKAKQLVGTKDKKRIQEKIEKLKQTMREEKEGIKDKNNNTNDDPDDLIVESGANRIFPAAHPAVTIQYEAGRGRFAVASEDIEAGTTLVREAPFIFSLNPEQFGTHCQTCFSVVIAVVPCPNCTWVCFCTLQCRDKAMATFHKYECGISKLLNDSGLNIYPFLALRAISQTNLEELKKTVGGVKLELLQEDVVPDQTTRRDLEHVLNLVGHQAEITQEQWLLRCAVVIFLVRCLKVTGYFNLQSAHKAKVEDQFLTPDELFVGQILLRLLNVIPCNSHDIAEFETPVTKAFVPACNKISLGAGLFPFLALFNHSCEPSFMRCNKGNQIICVANKDIKKGDEICENYGLMYTTRDKDDRQKILHDHYKFDCTCVACQECWPSLATMKEEARSDPSPESSQVIKATSQSAVDLLTKGHWTKGLEKVRACQTLAAEKTGSRPTLEVTEAQVAIWKGMWLKYGNMRLVKLV